MKLLFQASNRVKKKICLVTEGEKETRKVEENKNGDGGEKIKREEKEFLKRETDLKNKRKTPSGTNKRKG